MARMIYKCADKKCGTVYAVDYDQTRKLYMGYGRYSTEAFRINARGNEVKAFQDRCPNCKGERGKGATAKFVRGFKTEHVCDARCTNAKGFMCECSCGGENHGKGFMICEQIAA